MAPPLPTGARFATLRAGLVDATDEVVPDAGSHGPGCRHRTGSDPTARPLWVVRSRTGPPAKSPPRSAADHTAGGGGVDRHAVEASLSEGGS